MTVGAGQNLELDFNLPLNTALEMNYNFLITMTVETANGDVCSGTEVLSFTTGGIPELTIEVCEALEEDK